jgi:hypothetical protein
MIKPAALSLACWLVRWVEEMTLLKAQPLLAPLLALQSCSIAFQDSFSWGRGYAGNKTAYSAIQAALPDPKRILSLLPLNF